MDTLTALLAQAWQIVVGVLAFALSVATSAHVVLHKRDSRAAVGWVGLIWLAPIAGSLAYVLLGINRIRRRAALQRSYAPLLPWTGEFAQADPPATSVLPAGTEHLRSLMQLVDRVAGRPLTTGNAVRPLVDGDAAYPSMVDAIHHAQTSVALCTYIFESDDAGRLFADALEAAVARGVEVRVLIDAVGARYSRPPITKRLHRNGVPTALFGRTLLPWRMPYINLRNHRKLLVVDGRVGFTGGMNIREACLLQRSPLFPTRDLHFRIEGPVVAQLMQTFAEDWAFATNEVLTGPRWFPALEPRAEVAARGITDGPDADFEKALHVLLGAVACAQRSLRVLTPYFVPDAVLIRALNVAALRGVRIEIILPERNNLALVHWAATHQLWQILQHGCRVYYTHGPFDHSKVMVVDGAWVLLGSSNWDARSLRLNFEFDVECYDRALAQSLEAIIDAKLADARRITRADVDARPLPVKLRDGIARLAAPYL